MRRSVKKKRGSILIEVLLSLSMMLLIFGSGSALLQLYSRITFDSTDLQNRLGIVQLREQLSLAYDLKVEKDELQYLIKEENYRLSLVNGRLVQQPGTLIFLLDLEDCEFVREEEEIVIHYRVKERQYIEVIACER